MPGIPEALVIRPKDSTKKACECSACLMILRNPQMCPGCKISLCRSCLTKDAKCPFCKLLAIQATIGTFEMCLFSCPKCSNNVAFNELDDHASKCGLPLCLNYDRCRSIAFKEFGDEYCSKGCAVFIKSKQHLNDSNQVMTILFN